MLLACTPGGISALQFTTRLKGASLYAATSTFLLSFIAVFVSPLLFAAVHPQNITRGHAVWSPSSLHRVCLIVPLLVGLFVRRRCGKSGEARLSKLCALLSAVSFFAVVILMMSMRKDAMNAVGKGSCSLHASLHSHLDGHRLVHGRTGETDASVACHRDGDAQHRFVSAWWR